MLRLSDRLREIPQAISPFSNDDRPRSPEALIEEAYERGYAEAERAAALKAAEAATAWRAQWQEEQKLLRNQWIEEEGHALSEQIRSAFEQLEASTQHSLAKVLSQILGTEIVNKALAEFETLLKARIEQTEAPAIIIRGPKDLLARISSLADAGVSFQEDEQNEGVSASCGNTLIETDFGPWLEKLREILS